ncbi:MAG: RES family NAD+ phosphorylase [Proteobacteria bacterium]|nr:RES family NAD+ phosphorylase [Pseudomonadota bacterium]
MLEFSDPTGPAVLAKFSPSKSSARREGWRGPRKRGVDRRFGALLIHQQSGAGGGRCDAVGGAHSQALGAALLTAGSNGVLYRSVRRPTGECIACFRPPLVLNLRPAAHYEYIWSGRPPPWIQRSGA